MTSNETLIDRIRVVNPIPNDDETMLSTAALLTAVDERSGVMQTDLVETEVAKPPEKRRKGLFVAAVAFVLVLVVGVVAALTLSGGTDDVSPAVATIESSPPTTATPPTTAAPTTTMAPTTTLGPEAAWEAIPPMGADGADRVRTTAFAVPFSFESGLLEDLGESEDWLTIIHPLGVNGSIDFTLGLDTVEATVAALSAIHDLYPDAAMNDPVPVTVGGAQGVAFETAGLPAVLPEGADHPFIFANPEEGPDTWTIGSFGFGSNDSGSGEILVVDVDGQIVVMGYGASPVCIFCPSPPTAGQVDAAKARLKALIDSIEWKDLT